MTLFSPLSHREQASQLFRKAELSGNTFVEQSAPLIDALQCKSMLFLGGVFSRMLGRFDGCMVDAPGLEATWHCIGGLEFDHRESAAELENGYRAPMILSDDNLANARAGMQQFTRMWFQKTLQCSEQASQSQYSRIELDTQVRYYAAAARLAGDTNGLALKALAFDIAFTEVVENFRSALGHEGIESKHICVIGQKWPVNRPADWPFLSNFNSLGFLFEIDITFNSQTASTWLNPDGRHYNFLNINIAAMHGPLADSLRSIFGVQIKPEQDAKIYENATSLHYCSRILIDRLSPIS